MASTISKNKKNHEAAVKALDAAEAYFKRQKLDSAIKEATQAKNLDPKLPNADNFITAYKIHRAVSCKRNWYVVLGIPECTHSLNISKRYKQLALMVHPDKNVSSAAEGAFKHVKDALDYLSDPMRKKDYDTYFAAGGRKAATATSATEAEKEAAWEAAGAGEAASWKAAAEANAAREARAAARRKADAAAAAEREAVAAAARREMNARKQHPMSEIEHGISLIMKHSPKYMQPKFSVW